MTHLRLEGLSKSFGSTTVLDAIDLSVGQGQLVCLLGPSGCGKTTTLRLIAGFMEPSAGRIVVGGRTLSEPGNALPPERRGMSMIFQSYALWPHMTIFDNVAYGLALRKMPRADIATRVGRILEAVKLSHLAERYPAELSGGQQQRVALARALVVEPEILLLDEPLSNLDAALREEMRFEVRRLHDAFRYTTVYVTHDQAEAMTTADLIVVMNQGRIEQAGGPEEIYARPRSAFVATFLGGANILSGTARDAQHLDIGAATLRCAEAGFAPGGRSARPSSAPPATSCSRSRTERSCVPPRRPTSRSPATATCSSPCRRPDAAPSWPEPRAIAHGKRKRKRKRRTR
jgi:iron(III) transport system ATP-binding protein